MKPSSRIILALFVIEAGLAGLWWLLLDRLRTGALKPSGSMAETVSTLSTTLGAAMGGLAGLGLALYLALRLRGR